MILNQAYLPGAKAPRNGVTDIDEDRDRVELMVARTAVDLQKPLLAICRGMQVLNVALGGSLWEDVELLMPQAMHHEFVHTHPRNHLAHNVSIEPEFFTGKAVRQHRNGR